MKTLASCKPSEFLRQTNRIKRSAEKWVKTTRIMELRADAPELEKVPEDAPLDEREAITKRNEELIRSKGLENFSKMFDSVFEDHPEETLELLALCCFVEPKDVDDYPVSEYLKAFTSLLNDEAVIGFFTSLVSLAQTNISLALKA